VVYFLSDFDPSGVAMPGYVEDLLTRLSGIHTPVQRIGLKRAQAEQHNLLGRPLKNSDSRAERFRKEHGDEAFELDGLPPWVLRNLVREAVEPLIDWSVRGQQEAKTEECRKRLREVLRLAEEDELL
jgi:hypothetical protein